MAEVEQDISFNQYSNVSLYGRPKMDQLLNWIVAKIPGEWETVGALLEIPSDKLNAIKVNTSLGGNPDRMFHEVMKLWERNPHPEAPYTWATILQILASPSVGRQTLAEEIAKKIPIIKSEAKSTCTPTSTTTIRYYTDDDLKKLCGCGHCSLEDIIIKGCNQPEAMARFPILDVTSLPPCKLQQYMYIVQKEADRINEIFATLSSNLCDSMIERRINYKSVVAFIKTIRHIEISAAPENISELQDKLDKAQDLHDVFIVLSKITSWFNHHPLGSLVRKYGSAEDNEAYRKFTEEDLMKYLSRSITEIPKDAFALESIEGSGSFILKIDHPLEHEIISGQQLLNLTGRVAEALDIPINCLDLKYINIGCLEVEFTIPLFYCNERFPLCTKYIEKLVHVAIDGPNNIAIRIKTIWYGKDEFYNISDFYHQIMSDTTSDESSLSSSEDKLIEIDHDCDLTNSNTEAASINEIHHSIQDLVLTESNGEIISIHHNYQHSLTANNTCQNKHTNH